MLQISQKSEYAIIFLLSLAKSQDQYLSLTKIAKLNNLPYRFLSVIAGELKNAKFIDSKEGQSGGYFLTKKPQAINLLEVINLIDGQTGLIRCQREKTCARSNICHIKSVWNNIQEKIENILKNYTLKDLL